MKIIFIAIKGINKIGGIETYTKEVGCQLVKQGHEVIVYEMSHKGNTSEYEQDGIRIIPLPTFKAKSLAKITLVLRASFHQLKHKDVDIVHYHAIGPSMFSFIPRLVGRTTIVQSHGHEWLRASWGYTAKSFFKLSERLTFVFASGVTSVSKELRDYYEDKYNHPVQYIPNGINPPIFTKPNLIKKYGLEHKKYILFLGRISREKGIHLLIEAYQQLNCDMKLAVVGQQRNGDNYLEDLKQLADNSSNILFPGSATGDLWNEFYSNAAIFVLPSEIEGLPISLLEAMSFKNCCVVSDIDANKEALGDTGLTFKNTDSESLRETLQDLIDNPKRMEIFGEMAYRRVHTYFTWDVVVNKLISYYQGYLPDQKQEPDSEPIRHKCNHKEI